MSAELWKTIFDYAAIILLFLTFVAGTGAFIFGNIVSKRQTERADNAEKELGSLHKSIRPRLLDPKAFLAELKDKPKATVEILYQPNDPEAFSLGQQIQRWLGPGANKDGAGWVISDLRPMRDEDSITGWPLNSPKVPMATKSGSWTGLGLTVKDWPNDDADPGAMLREETAVSALAFALLKSGAGGGMITSDARLPVGLIRIIIGPKMGY